MPKHTVKKPKFFVVTNQPNVSKENKKEYATDKRIQELARRGYKDTNIRYMMGYENFPLRRIQEGMKAKGVIRDGKL